MKIRYYRNFLKIAVEYLPQFDNVIYCLHIVYVFISFISFLLLRWIRLLSSIGSRSKSVIRSFEYVLNNAFRKIFATKSCDIANECVIMFNCSVYDMVLRRKRKFLNKLQYNENTLCKMFRDRVKFELTELSVSHS